MWLSSSFAWVFLNSGNFYTDMWLSWIKSLECHRNNFWLTENQAHFSSTDSYSKLCRTVWDLLSQVLCLSITEGVVRGHLFLLLSYATAVAILKLLDIYIPFHLTKTFFHSPIGLSFSVDWTHTRCTVLWETRAEDISSLSHPKKS